MKRTVIVHLPKLSTANPYYFDSARLSSGIRCVMELQSNPLIVGAKRAELTKIIGGHRNKSGDDFCAVLELEEYSDDIEKRLTSFCDKFGMNVSEERKC